MLLRTHKRKVILIGIVYVKNQGGIEFRNLQTLNKIKVLLLKWVGDLGLIKTPFGVKL